MYLQEASNKFLDRNPSCEAEVNELRTQTYWNTSPKELA
jgi:hypothetical protein